jgi:uncharacterized protein (DUF2126 family)
MGYRLPLDSQPWVKAKATYPYVIRPTDAALVPLPSRAPCADIRRCGPSAAQEPRTQRQPREAAPSARCGKRIGRWITRTALCAEPRDGKLYIFMPPTERWRTTSNWSPPSRRPPPKRCSCRSSSKATSRRATRAS